jgi:hypothetical protein
LIEAAVAGLIGLPERCLRLPRLPGNWKQLRDAPLLEVG